MNKLKLIAKVIKPLLKPLLYALAVIIIITGLFSAIGIYKEITSKSYINGDLLGFENAFKQENFSFKTNSLSFYTDPVEENSFIYEITLLPVEEFDGLNKKYEVIFNDYEIINASINAGMVEFNQIIEFLNVDNSTINSTTINISLEFYADKTNLKVGTRTENIAYLEQYLNLNSFSLRVNEIK
ncbi:MAG: hypothetical protein IJZ29_04320 [Clostridia bacterium]|nr:hypothetical protein [Clostridia bacterium]